MSPPKMRSAKNILVAVRLIPPTSRLSVTNPANFLEALRQDQKPRPPAAGVVHSRRSSPGGLATGEKGLRYSLEMGVHCIRERFAFALANTIDNGIVDQPKA